MLKRSLIVAAVVLLGMVGLSRLFRDARPIFRYRSGPISSLDPAVASDHASLRESARAYQTPMRLERAMGTIVARPWILESPPRVFGQGRRLELTFRAGVRFNESGLFKSGQRELDACDWVKSILRHADPRVGSPWFPFLARRIEGLREWAKLAQNRGDAAYASLPKGLSCRQRQAVVELISPDPEFAYFLAHPAASVLPVDEIVEKKWSVGTQPAGSGSFVLRGKLGSTLEWRSVDRVHPIQSIRVDTSSESFRDWDRFIRGDLDIIELPKDLGPTLVQTDGELFQKWKDQGIQLQKIQRADMVLIAFQMNDPILGKERGVRQALSRALLSSAVIDRVFGGRAVAAVSPLPPGIPGYDSALKNPFRDGDLAQAKDTLGFAGHPHGRGLPEFILACLAHPVEQELCRAVSARWELLGVRTKIVTLEARERRKKILSGEVHFWPVTWVSDFPASATYLEIFDPEIGPPEMPAPRSVLPEFRKALGHLRSTPAGKSKALHEALSLLNREAPGAYLVHRLQYWLIRPGVFGLNWQDFSWHEFDQLRKSEAASALDSRSN